MQSLLQSTKFKMPQYKKNDIRSLFNHNDHDAPSHAPPPIITMITAPPLSRHTTLPLPKSSSSFSQKKPTIKSEIICLCEAYEKAFEKHKIIKIPDAKVVNDVIREIVETHKIKPKKLYRYFHHVKYNDYIRDVHIYPLETLLSDPFKFIKFEHQFISYKEAMSICTAKELIPDIQLRKNAWMYDYFISKQNKFYISKTESEQLLIDFNNEFKLHRNAEQILLKTIIETRFGKESYFTIQEFVDFEKQLGDKVIDLFYDDSVSVVDDHPSVVDSHIQSYIQKYKKDDFTFEPEQIEAIKKGCNLNSTPTQPIQLINITGPPGTGKSTIVECIINYKLNCGASIAIMAPTGLAQKNLKKNCKFDPVFDKNIIFSTIHRAIHVTFKDKKNTFTPDMMIIDESSMIDLFLFNQLLIACERFKCSLILIGDVNQLSPIGPGTPFESIINFGYFHTTRLTNIKRQDGKLKEIITKLNSQNGVHYNDFDNACSTFIEAKTSEDFERVVTDIYKKETEMAILAKSSIDIHTMCPQRAKIGGVFQLNPIIQNLKNPHGVELYVKKYEDSHTHAFYEGDLVIRTENDYKDDKKVRVNGDIGTIHETKTIIKKYGKDVYSYTYTVKYADDNDEETGLTPEDIRDAFVPFYASSVHKMQGSQKPVIIFIVSPFHNFCLTNENSKKLVYTAISRCRSNFYVVGDKQLFIKSQKLKADYVYPTVFMKGFIRYKDDF